MTSPHTQTLQTQLIQAMLPHVPFDGWTQGTLLRAAQDLQIPPTDHAFLFDGSMDQVLSFYGQYMRNGLIKQLETLSTEGLGVTGRIKLALTTHFDRLDPLVERETFKYFSHPLRLLEAQRMTFDLMDDMWHWAGDRSTDYNYYSKRLLLEGVYGSSFLYWLWQNPTEEALAEFIQGRLDNVLIITKLKNKIRGFMSPFKPAVK